jgi:hypothetical protein
MELRSGVRLINSRCLCQSTPLSSQDPKRLETFVGLGDECNRRSDLRGGSKGGQGGQEEGEENDEGEERTRRTPIKSAARDRESGLAGISSEDGLLEWP